MRRRVATIAMGLLLVACPESETPPPKVPLAKRAATDLECPTAQLNMNSDDDLLWVVRGCDRVGYYVKRCDECLDPVAVAAGVPMTNRCDCEWVTTKKRPKRP